MAPPRKPPVNPAQQAFQRYQTRRAADGFEDVVEARGAAWKSFVGERGMRLKRVLQGFRLLGNPKYPPSNEASLAFVRDVMNRLGMPLPAVPVLRLPEWFTSAQGGRPLGWREVPAGMAQVSANEGRPAVVIGVGLGVNHLAAIVCPDDAGTAANPTIVMVSDEFALDPGTLIQGFRGEPTRFFALHT